MLKWSPKLVITESVKGSVNRRMLLYQHRNFHHKDKLILSLLWESLYLERQFYIEIGHAPPCPWEFTHFDISFIHILEEVLDPVFILHIMKHQKPHTWTESRKCCLLFGPLRHVAVISQVYFSNLFSRWIAWALCEKFLMWMSSGNGLVPSGFKTLPEPMLT